MIVSTSLTSDLIRKLLATQRELAKHEETRPPRGEAISADPATVARLLDMDADVQQIFRKNGWSAAEYVSTHTTIVQTLIAMDELDTGDAKRLPDDVSEANVQFLRNVPDDVEEAFRRWRQANVDPALRELREMRREMRRVK